MQIALAMAELIQSWILVHGSTSSKSKWCLNYTSLSHLETAKMKERKEEEKKKQIYKIYVHRVLCMYRVRVVRELVSCCN